MRLDTAHGDLKMNVDELKRLLERKNDGDHLSDDTAKYLAEKLMFKSAEIQAN